MLIHTVLAVTFVIVLVGIGAKSEVVRTQTGLCAHNLILIPYPHPLRHTVYINCKLCSTKLQHSMYKHVQDKYITYRSFSINTEKRSI